MQLTLDLYNPTEKQKNLDDHWNALKKKRSMKEAAKYTAFVLMTDRLFSEVRNV